MFYFIYRVLNNAQRLLESKFQNQRIINYKKSTLNPGGNYTGINLRNCNLQGTNLRGADLRGADLSNADLSQVCLSFANLSKANLQNSLLVNTKLIWTDLSHANLKGANVIGAQMMSANLKNSDLKQTLLWHVDLQNANLSGCNLSRSKLCQNNLSNTKLENCNFRCATSQKTSLLKTLPKNIEIENNIVNINHNFRNLEAAYKILLEEIYILQEIVEKNRYNSRINYTHYKEFIAIVTTDSNRFKSEISQKKSEINKILKSYSDFYSETINNKYLQIELIDIIEGIDDIYQAIRTVHRAWKYLVQSIFLTSD